MKVCKNLCRSILSICTMVQLEHVESETIVLGTHSTIIPYAGVEAASEADTDLESISRDIDHGLRNDVV